MIIIIIIICSEILYFSQHDVASFGRDTGFVESHKKSQRVTTNRPLQYFQKLQMTNWEGRRTKQMHFAILQPVFKTFTKYLCCKFKFISRYKLNTGAHLFFSKIDNELTSCLIVFIEIVLKVFKTRKFVFRTKEIIPLIKWT